MFKAIHVIPEYTLSSIGIADTVLPVSSSFGAKIYQQLTDVSDYTYLKISTQVSVEVVKAISAVPGLVTVVRAQDNTTAYAFPAGSKIEYILPAQAVAEMISSALAVAGVNDMTFSINAPHTVVNNEGAVTIDIRPPVISSPDGTIDVTGEGGVFGLAVVRGAFGCCD